MTEIKGKLWTVALSLLVFSGVAAAQVLAPTELQKRGNDANPIYKITINVVSRQTTAINYRHHDGATTIDFKGTPLLPKAHGEAKVESKKGYIEVDAKFDGLEPASRFGSEYLTYVLWAISPEGRALNLGEVILDGDDSKLEVSSDLQAFGLIVTAEPYYAVTQPSDVVVMENFLRPETRGVVEQVNANYELLQRGLYTVNVPPEQLKPFALDKKVSLDIYQARNAVRIARWTGASQFANESFSKAEQLLQQAEDNRVQKHSKTSAMMARQAIQTAEDSRLIALKRQNDDRLEKERAAAAQKGADERAAAERARLDAERAEQQRTLEARRAADADMQRAAADAQRAAAEVNAQRSVAQAKLETERADNERRAAEAAAERSRQAALKAETEKQELRQQLITQFNAILQTHDSSRGLLVNMSDVVFDSGQATLKPGAREKLAKISGIIQAHPGLKLEIEGHTDNTGSDDLNQALSEKRAQEVRSFLIQNGVAATSITALGYGESRPVASNETATGRQLNRRVEMIVSGDIISQPVILSSTLGSGR